MATNEILIPIPGRLHSVATEGHVAGADEIYDDTLSKDQQTINAEVNAALGEGGTVDEKIAEAIDDALEDVAFIDDSESSPAVVPGFDPTTDTVHVTAQTLSEQQKAQARTNIGLNDVDAKIAAEASARQSGDQATVNTVNSAISAQNTKIAQQDSNISTRFSQQDEKMDNMQATINEKQLEIGAVQTDDEPTPNSGNHLTSGTIASAYGHYIDNQEYLQVTTDSDDKILEGIKTDGTKTINLPIETPATIIGCESSPEWIQITTDSDGKIIEGITAEGKKKVMVETTFKDKTIGEIASEEFENKSTLDKFSESGGDLFWNGGVINTDNNSTIISIQNYNQTKEDKSNNNIKYILYSDGSAPFMRVIRNGKIYQDRSNRNDLAKVALFGDTHFGYTMDGSLVLDPTTEDRDGMAFAESNNKNPDFSLILGDVLQGGTVEQVSESYRIYYQKLGLLDNPCFPIEGNHDEFTPVIDHDLIKNGIIEFGKVRIIIFNAHYAGAVTDIGRHNGDVTDETYTWLSNALEDSYNNGFITILVCHYALYYDSDDPNWNQSLRNHRDDIVALCHQYNVRLYIHGHQHRKGLDHKIVANGSITLDMTNVLFGWTHVSYSVMEITESGFNIIEYDTMTDNVLHTLFIPMTNQASGTIYN